MVSVDLFKRRVCSICGGAALSTGVCIDVTCLGSNTGEETKEHKCEYLPIKKLCSMQENYFCIPMSYFKENGYLRGGALIESQDYYLAVGWEIDNVNFKSEMKAVFIQGGILNSINSKFKDTDKEFALFAMWIDYVAGKLRVKVLCEEENYVRHMRNFNDKTLELLRERYTEIRGD